MPDTTASQMPTTFNSQVPTATPLTPAGPASQTTVFNMPTPTSPSILEAITKSIPPLFRTVCPFSLTGTPCPIHTCQMKRLCPRFNDRSGLNTCTGHNGCRHLHERPTCLGEAEGVGCEYAQHRNEPPPTGKGKGKEREKEKNKGKGKMSEVDAARRNHSRCFVHRHQCGPEEWRLRVVIADLRLAHRQGLYNH